MAAAAGSIFVLEGEEHGFVEATRLVAREGGEVLGVGTYREKLGDNPVCYLRLVGGTPDDYRQSPAQQRLQCIGRS